MSRLHLTSKDHDEAEFATVRQMSWLRRKNQRQPKTLSPRPADSVSSHWTPVAKYLGDGRTRVDAGNKSMLTSVRECQYGQQSSPFIEYGVTAIILSWHYGYNLTL